MMNIDPLLLPILANMPPAPTDVAEQRANELASSRQIVGTLTPPIPDSVRLRETEAPGDPAVPVTIYTPEGDRTRAALLFLHGGGWASGSVEAAGGHCATLAADADVVVVSVEYRLIPEHPFPAGIDDGWTALNWLVAHADELGVDAARIAIGGESAGANLAAAIALRARDAGAPALALQLLEVPVLDLGEPRRPAWFEVHEQFPDFAQAMDAAGQRYLDAGADPEDPRVSPLRAADLTGLPPAVLLAAEVDPVRDDSAAYAERLLDAGVPARATTFAGILHGTESFTLLLPSAREWHRELVDALRGI